MTTLVEFVQQSLSLADLRNLSVENPVVIRVNAPASIEEFQIVVAHKEPSFSILPYNVTWIVADPASANYKRAMRRVTSLPFAGYRNTWEILTTFEDIFAVAQYYEYSGSFQIGEVELNGITQATMKMRGTVKLRNNPVDTDPEADINNPVVVSSNDPRMFDAREPTPHTHPQQAAEMLAGSTGLNEFFVTIKDSAPPEAGQVLILTGAGDEPNEMMGYWRNVNQSDVDYNGPTFDELEIYTSAAEFNEKQTYVFRANAKFSDGTSVENVPALWSIVVGGEYANISATTGTLNSNEIVGDKTVRIQATWMHAASGQSRNKIFEFTLKDGTVYRILESITIEGLTTVNEGVATTYGVIAHYDDGTSQGVVPSTFLNSNSSVGSLNSTTGVFTAAQIVGGNTTTTISASYSEGGVSKSASINITVVDTTVYPVTAVINGPTTVNENSNSTYSLIVSFSDGSSRAVSVTNWSSSTPTAAVISPVSGALTANEVNGNQLTVISASYTSEGSTVNATQEVTVRDLTVYPESANIIGSAAINEGTAATYQFRVNFSNGTNMIVPVSNWSSNDTTVATINATTGVLTAAADVKPSKTTVIAASYTSEGTTVSANRTITITDVTPYPQSAVITGSANIDEGTTVSLQLQVTLTTGSQTTVNATSWTSSDTQLATITSNGVVVVTDNVVGNKQFSITGTFTLNGDTIEVTKVFTIVDRTSYPVSATINGPSSVNEGSDTQYELNVTFADSTSRIVTATSWTFSNAEAGSVNSGGLFSPIGNTKGNKSGSLVASYTLDGVTVNANKTLTVVDSTKYPQSAIISGSTVVNENTTASYQLSVTYSDGTTSFVPVTTWEVTAGEEIATISTDGILTVSEVGIGDKAITIVASHTVDDVTASAELDITAKDLTVYPASVVIAGANTTNEGTTGIYAAQVTYTDGSVDDKTASVTWSLDDETHATINSGNLAVRQINGGNKSVVISVSLSENGVTKTATKTVTLVDSTIYPASAEIIGPVEFDEGDAEQQYILRVTKTDETTEDVTVNNWTSSNPSAGIMLNIGAFTPVAAVTGDAITTEISASYTLDGVTVTGTTTIRVNDATVYPVSARIIGSDFVVENTSTVYQLEVTFTNEVVELRTVNSWSLEATDHATIDNAGELIGNEVRGNQTVTILADFTSEGVTVNAEKEVTVRDATVYVNSLAITGPSEVTEGSTINFQATATYTDGSTQPVEAVWSVAPTDFGNIDTEGNFITAENVVGDHTVIVSAVYEEDGVEVSITNGLLVKDASPYPTAVAIIAPASLNEGQSSTLQLRVTYSNGSTVTAASGVTWSVDDGSYATVTTSGVFTAAQVAGGNKTSVVTAQYVESGLDFEVTANIVVVDTTRYPQSLEVTGPNQVNESTSGHAYTATVTYQDDSTANVTTASGITWTVDSGSIVDGLFTAPSVTANRTVKVTATYIEAGQTVTKTFNTQVMNVVVVPQSVAISGPSTVAPSGVANFTATVTYNNGTSLDKTVNGTWGRSNAAAGSIGTATGVFTAAALTSTAETNVTFSYTEEGSTVSATHTLSVEIPPIPLARYGSGEFQGYPHWTGGKDDGMNGGKNLNGDDYVQYQGPQDFFEKTLVNTMPTNEGEQEFTIDLTLVNRYGFFAHPSDLGTATHIDLETGWPGGWDGATWTVDGGFDETYGPVELMLDDGSGPRLWKIYRTDFSGIGIWSWSVTYS